MIPKMINWLAVSIGSLIARVRRLVAAMASRSARRSALPTFSNDLLFSIAGRRRLRLNHVAAHGRPNWADVSSRVAVAKFYAASLEIVLTLTP